jgi:hypothetical protein
MVYILGLTVLGTVVRELGGLKRFKCPGGDAVTGARKARESGPELRKCADSGYEGMGARETLLVLSGLCYASSRCCSVSAPESLLQVLLLKSHPVEQEVTL